jgi:hypothetical protein
MNRRCYARGNGQSRGAAGPTGRRVVDRKKVARVGPECERPPRATCRQGIGPWPHVPPSSRPTQRRPHHVVEPRDFVVVVIVVVGVGVGHPHVDDGFGTHRSAIKAAHEFPGSFTASSWDRAVADGCSGSGGRKPSVGVPHEKRRQTPDRLGRRPAPFQGSPFGPVVVNRPDQKQRIGRRPFMSRTVSALGTLTDPVLDRLQGQSWGSTHVLSDWQGQVAAGAKTRPMPSASARNGDRPRRGFGSPPAFVRGSCATSTGAAAARPRPRPSFGSVPMRDTSPRGTRGLDCSRSASRRGARRSTRSDRVPREEVRIVEEPVLSSTIVRTATGSRRRDRSHLASRSRLIASSCSSSSNAGSSSLAAAAVSSGASRSVVVALVRHGGEEMTNSDGRNAKIEIRT